LDWTGTPSLTVSRSIHLPGSKPAPHGASAANSSTSPLPSSSFSSSFSRLVSTTHDTSSFWLPSGGGSVIWSFFRVAVHSFTNTAPCCACPQSCLFDLTRHHRYYYRYYIYFTWNPLLTMCSHSIQFSYKTPNDPSFKPCEWWPLCFNSHSVFISSIGAGSPGQYLINAISCWTAALKHQTAELYRCFRTWHQCRFQRRRSVFRLLTRDSTQFPPLQSHTNANIQEAQTPLRCLLSLSILAQKINIHLRPSLMLVKQAQQCQYTICPDELRTLQNCLTSSSILAQI